MWVRRRRRLVLAREGSGRFREVCYSFPSLPSSPSLLENQNLSYIISIASVSGYRILIFVCACVRVQAISTASSMNRTGMMHACSLRRGVNGRARRRRGALRLRSKGTAHSLIHSRANERLGMGSWLMSLSS